MLSLSSCDDFLNVQPQGVNSSDQYFTNDYQAIESLDGVYAYYHQEGGFGREIFWEQGAACDIVWGVEVEAIILSLHLSTLVTSLPLEMCGRGSSTAFSVVIGS